MKPAPDADLHYPFGDALPGPAEVFPVSPGIAWVRMGLPFMLDHVNVWLIRDRLDGREGWTLVDTGLANDATRERWAQIFEHQMDGLPLLRVVATHMHPDHIGLADWLTGRWSTAAHPCRLWISGTDFAVARMLVQRAGGEGGEQSAAHFHAHGLTDPEAQQKVRARGNYYQSMVPTVPQTYRRLRPGDVLQMGGGDWRCIGGWGHAPEHLSFYSAEQGVLISGDMLLPRISTNVSVIEAEPEGNPLAQFLESLEAMADLPDETLVLPSHGKPFRGLRARIRQLQAHHAERLDETWQACLTQPLSAADLLPVLFRRRLDLHQTTFAMGEAIAHLHALWYAGRLRRERDDQGVYRFSAVT